MEPVHVHQAPFLSGESRCFVPGQSEHVVNMEMRTHGHPRQPAEEEIDEFDREMDEILLEALEAVSPSPSLD